jgi:murein L,D-transpeptidase YcbB/YkuD
MKDETGHVEIPKGEPLKPGKKDPRVPKITKRLKQLGMLDEAYFPKDSTYDEKLQEAIKKFQKEKGLATDEILGNSTIKELNMDAKARYWQILANLERWRWYPRDLGNHYVLINIPNYKLSVVKNGNVMRSHNVIAGDPQHHTPVFSDSIQYIVINPEWNIPSSIRDNEIIPQIRKNPNYLQSRNMYVTDGSGNRVDPGTVDWAGGEGQNYRIVQGSGASNSLGHLKIIYPNQYSIYLHDTPAKAIFDQNIRAESHGCVRVEKVIELAAYILKDQNEWNVERIKETIATGKTQKVKVTQPILVHHFYWTAWREDGGTVFINDIYGLDVLVVDALKK